LAFDLLPQWVRCLQAHAPFICGEPPTPSQESTAMWAFDLAFGYLMESGKITSAIPGLYGKVAGGGANSTCQMPKKTFWPLMDIALESWQWWSG